MKNQLVPVRAQTFFAAFKSQVSAITFTSYLDATSKASSKAALLLFSVAVLLAGGATAVRGQSALDGFDPNANDTISVVVVQPDGKILIGGSFTSVSGVPRNHIARLNPDGTLDTAFDPNANSIVFAIAVQADGKVVVGGFFAGANSIGGAARNHIARLDATTGLADSFNPNADGDVYSLAIQADGKILAGGSFGNIGGQPRGGIARLDATTGLADAFNPSANATVFSIATQADGKVVVGGAFTGFGAQARHFIARLEATNGMPDSFDPAPNGVVRSVAVQADGKILAGGQFTSIGGTNRNYIARLDAITGVADSFNPNANSLVFSIAVQPDGKVLAGGYFSGASSIGGQSRNFIARLDPITGLADSFNPNAGNIVQSIAVQSDGKVLAGGNFGNVGGVGRSYIARMESDGRVDQTLNLSAVGNFVLATAVQPDGKILIGGGFTEVLGVARTNIARLNTDGTLDTVFNASANGSVHSIVVQRDGKILVGGEFHGANSIGAATRNYIARLDGTNGLADSFDPNANLNSTVFSIALQEDGKILVGGTFTNIGGAARNYIARLDAATGLADSFNPNAGDVVNSIAITPTDGKIYVGGTFTNIGGEPRNYLARLDATTGLVEGFDPNANNTVASIAWGGTGILVVGSFTSMGGLPRNHIARIKERFWAEPDDFDPNADALIETIAVQSDGKILAGGQFTNIGGQPRNRIARLDATTGAADSFDPNATNTVFSIAVQADGKILVGGGFSGTNSIGGQPRNLFARLINDTAARQSLLAWRFPYVDTNGQPFTVDKIEWQRSGSSPQFSRVTFEFSTNYSDYTSLSGQSVSYSALSDGYWSLEDYSVLPAAVPQNFWIRARGYYRSGYLNGSESIQESVFLTQFIVPPQPFLNIQLSANTNVVLSWASHYVFTLVTATNLSTNVWSVASPAPFISGTNYMVTNTIDGPMRFYRLRF